MRIVCQELEGWYLGEPDALADAYGKESLRNIGRRARFRDPDAVQQPSAALKKLVPEFQKTGGARLMGGFITRERNKSASFHALLTGIDKIWTEMNHDRE